MENEVKGKGKGGGKRSTKWELEDLGKTMRERDRME